MMKRAVVIIVICLFLVIGCLGHEMRATDVNDVLRNMVSCGDGHSSTTVFDRATGEWVTTCDMKEAH